MNAYESTKFGAQQRKRRGVFLRCESCQKEFYVVPSRLKQAEKQGVTTRYCSMACYNRLGEKGTFFGKKHKEKSIARMKEHPNRPRFKTGEDNPNFIRFGEDFKHKNAQTLRKRLLDERGEKCEECGYSEVPGVLEIHHVDRNRRNNDRENLRIICPTCHAVEHFRARDGSYNRLKGTEPCD